MGAISYTIEQTEWLKNNFWNSKSSKDLAEMFNARFNENKTGTEIAGRCGYIGLRREKGYSDEEVSWFKENAYNYSTHEEVAEAYNKVFRKNRTEYAIKRTLQKLGIKIYQFYTEKKLNWIRDNYNNFETVVELTEEFNKQFSCSKEPYAIGKQCSKLGLKKDFGYTEEQKQWLIDNYDNYDAVVDLAREFIKVFDLEKNYKSVADYCFRKLGLNKDINKKVVPNKKYNIGDEKFEGGYCYIKVKEYERTGKYDNKKQKQCWKQKQRVTWEKYYNQEVPEDCQIIFLNGDRSDFDIENLYCVKKKYLPYMERNHWFSDNPELTLTAIKWCELMYATQD